MALAIEVISLQIPMSGYHFCVKAGLMAAALGLMAPELSTAAPNYGAQAVLASARTAAGRLDLSGIRVESGTETASGLTGRWSKSIDLETGRTRNVADFGFFRTTEVWDGKSYWRQDRSGGVHALNSPFAQENNLTEAWLASLGYLKPDAAGAKVKRLADGVEAGGRFAIVRATPRAGQTVDLWFDTKTHHLHRTVQIMTTYTKTVTYEDYRERSGIPVASKITTEDGVDADRDVIRIENVSLAKSASEFVRPQALDDFSIAGGKSTVPIEFDGDVIVEAKLNGQGPFAFILDTGGHDIVTPEVAALLHLKPVGAGASGGSGEGTMPLQFAQIDRLEIGGATLRNQSFTVIPLPVDTTERGARQPLAGILGLELFERFAIRLDYGKKSLSLQSLSGYKYEGMGTAVPIFFSDDQPLFDAKIANVPGQIALDTGNSGTLIVQGVWADGHALQRQMMSGFPSLGYGMGGASQSWSSRVDFEVAGTLFRGVIAHYSKDQKGAFSSRTEAGNVGNDILAGFTLEFDYAHGEVWFEAAPGHAPRVFDRAGLSFFKEDADAFKVSAVAAGTPAAEAGLRTDDAITAVDGKPASQVSGWDLRRSMRAPPGTKVTLALIRNGQPLTVVVILRELLPAAS
jgi:hypothetical protein